MTYKCFSAAGLDLAFCIESFPGPCHKLFLGTLVKGTLVTDAFAQPQDIWIWMNVSMSCWYLI